ncbi:hypothetical protein CYMTET_55185 [Cymbomonas tetramitiformis]|uniref:Uncharacterized protein n=1 Tax=Cymbomonas tetramitiformis TaxID=36881 RepID=A0AAE0BEY9_9CHLO|nr:hypothetical protein CYMTET_55185 [Cymbomonas tetramitiformis]
MRAYFAPEELNEENEAVVVYVVGYLIVSGRNNTSEAAAYITLHNETTCFVASDRHIIFDLAGRTINTSFSPAKLSIHASREQSKKVEAMLINTVFKCVTDFQTGFEKKLVNMMTDKFLEFRRQVTCSEHAPIKGSGRRKRTPVHRAETANAITSESPVNRLPLRQLARRPKSGSATAKIGRGIRGCDLKQFMSATSVRKET